MRIVRPALLCLLIPFGVLGAQSVRTDTAGWRTQLAPGVRVRVWFPPKGSAPFIGSVVALQGDSLSLFASDTSRGTGRSNSVRRVVTSVEQVAYLPEVLRIDRSAGRTRFTGKGMLLGFTLGLAGGYLLGSATFSKCVQDTSRLINFKCHPQNAGEAGMMASGPAAMSFMLIGGIVGHVGTERWEDIASAAKVNAFVAPAADGRVAVGFRF